MRPLFRVPAYHLEHAGELGAYASLGVIGGFASLIFVKYIAYLRPKLRQLPPWTQYFQPAAAGLLIGLIGIKFPQVMGAGYSYMDQAMHEQYTWQILAMLGALKIVSTGLSFSSGTPGGLFAPTLFMGAMIGGAVGMAEHQIVPNIAIPVGAYALIGMGTLFAGILRAPMTSVFMILEVSGNYSIIVPVISRMRSPISSRVPSNRLRFRPAVAAGWTRLAFAGRGTRVAPVTSGRRNAASCWPNPHRQYDAARGPATLAGFGAGIFSGRFER